MRLLASADIHGDEGVCEWIVVQSRLLQVDAIVFAGDLLGVPDGFETVEKAMHTRSFLIHIHGHSHSNFGKDGRHFNVASAAQKRAMVIDLEARTYDLLDDRCSRPSLPW